MLTIATIIWGGMFVVVKGIVNQIPPIELVWFRYVIAIICLLILAWCKHLKWHWGWKGIGICALIGLLGYNLSLIAQETGTMLSNASMGAVVTTAMPFFTVILARIFLHHKLNIRKYIATFVAIAGVFVISANNLVQGQSVKGIIMFLISSLAWAIASLLFVKIPNSYSNLQVTIIAIGTSLIFLTPWTAVHLSTLNGVNFSSPRVIFSLLFIGCIATALAYMLWNGGMKIVGADTAGIIYLLQPISGTLLGWLILGEGISIGFLIGTLMILGSVIIYLHGKPRIRTK